jgi:hypothetical protein
MGCLLRIVAIAATGFLATISFSQTIPPADSSPIPYETGLSPSQVIRLLIPDYDERFAEACEHGSVLGGPLEDAGATIESCIRTDLGLPGRRFILVSIYFIRGECDGGCIDQYVGAIDLDSHGVIARFQGGGWMGQSGLRAFRLFPEPAPLTMAFVESTGSRGGGGSQNEIWIQPDLAKPDEEEAEQVISFPINRYNYGNRGGSALESEGSVEGPDAQHVVQFRSVTVYDPGLAGEQECEKPQKLPKTSWYQGAAIIEEVFSRTSFSAESAHMAAIEKSIYYRPEGADLVSFRTEARRVLSASCSGFPFDLPIRAFGNSWRPVSKSGNISAGHGNLAVSSRKGRWMARRVEDRHRDVSLDIESSKGRGLRKILMTQGRFSGEIEALGRSVDDSRVFAVVSFGDDDSALLSFSVDGIDDWWEETLSGRDPGFENGFVLKPAPKTR